MSWLSGKRHTEKASTAGRVRRARTDELVVEEVGEELLIYDKTTNRAHCLSGTAAKVWRACDGSTSTEVLATRLDLDSETVDQVLDELDGNSLLEDTPQVGYTRREMTARAAKVGAAAASIPFIYSVLVPTPAAAATPTVDQCLHYSAGNCDACKNTCGCCCACGGCAFPPNGNGCNVCYPIDQFPAIANSNPCAVPGVSGCSASGSCSPAAVPGACVDACAAGNPVPTGTGCEGVLGGC